MSSRIHINPDFPQVSDIALRLATKGPDADNWQLLYKNKRNHIYLTKVGEKWVTIKDFKVPNLVNSIIYTSLRPSKAKRSYEYAERLNKMGLHSPMPLAYVEVKNGLRLGHSYYICEYIEAKDMRNWEQQPNSAELLKSLAAEMAKMHRLGVWHKDFSPGNILYTGDSTHGYKFYFIDINRMKFSEHHKNRLMHCFRCINLDPSETRRLARYYAIAQGFDIGETEDWATRELEKYLSDKARHKKLKRLFKK